MFVAVWLVPSTFVEEFVKLVPLLVVPLLTVLTPPFVLPAPVKPTGFALVVPPGLEELTTRTQAGNPEVPTPGSVPAGQLMLVFDPLNALVTFAVPPIVLLPVLPFDVTEEMVGVATVVAWAFR